MGRTLIRQKSLAQVFRWTTDEEKAMQVQLARLAVLHEDFVIEYFGARADAIAELDMTDMLTRRFYFVRRTLATLAEIGSAIRVLDGNSAFNQAKQFWPDEPARQWRDAVGFFQDLENHTFLKEWRNDLGGHFLDRAARYAVETIDAAVIGSIRLQENERYHSVHMPFAYQFVAMALTRTKERGQTEEEFLETAFPFLVDASKHAAAAVHAIVEQHLFPKFG